MSLIRIVFLSALAFAAGLGIASPASAQAYPGKPIHIVVPFAPGGITDILARALGQKLTDTLGQQVVIDNKPGANSQIGAEAVAKAAPDGYTLLVSADTTFAINPHLYAKLGYDPVKDFAPISGLGISPQALVVHPSVPAIRGAALYFVGGPCCGTDGLTTSASGLMPRPLIGAKSLIGS